MPGSTVQPTVGSLRVPPEHTLYASITRLTAKLVYTTGPSGTLNSALLVATVHARALSPPPFLIFPISGFTKGLDSPSSWSVYDTIGNLEDTEREGAKWSSERLRYSALAAQYAGMR